MIQVLCRLINIFLTRPYYHLSSLKGIIIWYLNFWSDIEHNEYAVVTLNSSTKYVRSYVRGENIQYSKKVSEEYIEKLKHTNQCQRMWIQSHHRSRPSIMATFSRGRLANQLNSFAYQYAIWKVNIRISIQNGWADNLTFV